ATPSVDALAAGGLRYNGFHTTALCSPSRACLLTGRNHHSVGMRAISNWDTGFPHMRGGITPRAATVAELLRDRGYATLAAGKWHLAPMIETSAAGPHTNWPLQKGFDRFYGFLQGETDQFSPELTHDNHHIDPPGRPEDGYHVSEDIVDQATGWVRDLVSVRPDRPFFLYLAFGATHAPHQSPLEYRVRWRGRFEAGYDAVRAEWYERQLESGIVPLGTALAPRNPGVPPWEDLTPPQRAFSCRLQEAFAAMLEHTDAQIGRLVAFLRSVGRLDNTLFLVLSDNGASQEGGPLGVMDEFSFFNLRREDIDDLVARRLDDIGGPHSHSNYPWGWAQAGNSPLRWYKQNTYGGGVRDPLVVHWPAAIGPGGAVRPQFCHAVDVAATVLDVTGATVPDEFGGHPQIPLHGRSLRATFADPTAPAPRSVQYFEQMGHRGIWADGWKATTYHEAGHAYDLDEWELFHLDEDFSECHDLTDAEPDRLRDLVDLWWAEAGTYGVLPLDDRTLELFGVQARPATPHTGTVYRYRHPISHVPSDAAPLLGGRSWTITVEVVLDGPAEGVLYARGSHNVGHSFFLADGVLHFDYNALGVHHRASAPVALADGRHVLRASFDRSGTGGALRIGADGEELAEVEVPRLVRMLGSTGMDVGRDALSTVVDDYEGPNPFTGEIVELVVELRSPRSEEDVAATAMVEMARE
ncbi:MAG: arylsulfatase, partial [Acidobacteriota bacterium]|nr:arylsulfatase [Acidobacteriota bacterium]